GCGPRRSRPRAESAVRRTTSLAACPLHLLVVGRSARRWRCKWLAGFRSIRRVILARPDRSRRVPERACPSGGAVCLAVFLMGAERFFAALEIRRVSALRCA